MGCIDKKKKTTLRLFVMNISNMNNLNKWFLQIQHEIQLLITTAVSKKSRTSLVALGVLGVFAWL